MSKSGALRTATAVLAAAGCLVAACAVPAGATTGTTGLGTPRSTPAISSMSISKVNAGETTYATIFGARFAAGAQVSFGRGIKCAVQSVTATKVAVRLDVATTAATGARTLTVTNPNGGRATRRRALDVDFQAILTRWAVGQGAAGWTTSLVRPTFLTAPRLSISGTGITVDTATIGKGDTLDLALSVARHATATWRTLTISEGLASWIVENGVRVRAAPTVTSVTPLAQNTSNQGVRVQGANFEVCKDKEPTLSISGSGVTVDSVSAALGTVMYATLSVSASAPLGTRDVTVTNCDSGGTATSKQAFSVLGAPLVTKVASIALGVTRTEPVLGTNFTPTTTFSSSGSGITITHARYVSPKRMVVTIAVGASSSVGPHDLTAKDTGGAFSIATGVFTVDALPTETSLAPGGIGANTSVLLTVHGTGFRRRAELVLGVGATPDPSLSIGATTWVSSTELEAQITAPAGTTLRTDSVTVLNDDGGTAATLQFHTNPGPVLTFSSSLSKVGAVTASYTAPSGAPVGETYALRLCTNRAMSEGCRTRAAFKSGASAGALRAGTSYWALVTAPAGIGFFAAASLVVGPRRATSQLKAPSLRKVLPSATRKGGLLVTFYPSSNATRGQPYAATACTNRAMTTRCVTTRHLASGGQLTGLTPGAGYHVVVVALASSGYLAASSHVSGTVRATVQLGAPKVTRAALHGHVLSVAFTGARYAARSQSYTLTACANAALTKGCVVRQYYRSGKGVAGLTATAYYVRITAVASVGYLAAASSIVKT